MTSSALSHSGFNNCGFAVLHYKALTRRHAAVRHPDLVEATCERAGGSVRVHPTRLRSAPTWNW
jgi:hypothetical protein